MPFFPNLDVRTCSKSDNCPHAGKSSLPGAAVFVLLGEEIDRPGLCTALLLDVRLRLFEIQMIEISILAGGCRM